MTVIYAFNRIIVTITNITSKGFLLLAMKDLLTLNEASQWASQYLNKPVTTSNISYLVQYGRILKIESNNQLLISMQELIDYYKQTCQSKETRLKEKLGSDLNWALSFADLKESDTTKHIHRLHPYKGKFIPQLVEYFLDNHIDDFKKEKFFNPGDIILDPFCGSGTTLAQANELGLHAIGVDVSAFNAHISNAKLCSYNLEDVTKEINRISKLLLNYLLEKNCSAFEDNLLKELKKFNDAHFPMPEFRRKVVKKEIDEKTYGRQKEQEFLSIYEKLTQEYKIELETSDESFLNKWFIKTIRDEIYFVFDQIKQIENEDTKNLLTVILSRTIRSCRATTHSDLATIFEPVTTTYYCKKHGKICKPLFSIASWWNRYSKDTIKRIEEFQNLKTNTHQICLIGDSRNIDFSKRLKSEPKLGKLMENQKIAGIFSSPPYVGVIDYHEQHAYSYDLFGFERKDDLEIGPLFKGQGKEAQKSYIQGISDVLNNCKKYLIDDYNIFLVANDKHNLYPQIAEMSGMKIVNQYKRPVLNRVEKDRNAYSEIIFHLKKGHK